MSPGHGVIWLQSHKYQDCNVRTLFQTDWHSLVTVPGHSGKICHHLLWWQPWSGAQEMFPGPETLSRVSQSNVSSVTSPHHPEKCAKWFKIVTWSGTKMTHDNNVGTIRRVSIMISIYQISKNCCNLAFLQRRHSEISGLRHSVSSCVMTRETTSSVFGQREKVLSGSCKNQQLTNRNRKREIKTTRTKYWQTLELFTTNYSLIITTLNVTTRTQYQCLSRFAWTNS